MVGWLDNWRAPLGLISLATLASRLMPSLWFLAGSLGVPLVLVTCLLLTGWFGLFGRGLRRFQFGMGHLVDEDIPMFLPVLFMTVHYLHQRVIWEQVKLVAYGRCVESRLNRLSKLQVLPYGLSTS